MSAISSVISASAIVLLAFIQLSSSKHFRGGLMTWRPSPDSNDTANTVIFSFKMAWLRDRHPCDDTTIASRNLIAAEGGWYCEKGCDRIKQIMSTEIRCTGYSITNSWTSGENTFKYTFPSPGPFVLGFQGGAWTNLVSGGGSWSLQSTIDLRPRRDNGRINSSPISGTAPIIRLHQGCYYSLHIHHDDPDGDLVKCRWSEVKHENAIFANTDDKGYRTNECAGVCKAVPGANLTRTPCTIDFEPSTPGWYAVALMLEDFVSETDPVPLSQVPLQFMFRVLPRDSSSPDAIPCGTSLTFTDETPKDGECMVVTEGTTLETSIVLNERQEIARLSEVALVAPTGLIKSAITEYGPAQRGVDISWTPTLEQYGQHSFCFTASDDAGVGTEQRCVTLLAGAKRPSILTDTMTPFGKELSLYDTNFEVEFDQQLARPSSTKYIRVFKEGVYHSPVAQFDTSDDTAVFLEGRTLSFALDSDVLEYDSVYYVTIEEGAVRGVQKCGESSGGFTDFAGLTGKTGWYIKTGILEISSIDINVPSSRAGESPAIGSKAASGGAESVTVGERAVISCNVRGSPAPSIRLYHGETLLKEEKNATHLSFVLENTIEADEGTYRCEANNSIGADVQNITVFILVPPKMDTTGQNLTVTVGTKVSLTCRATGNPPPTLAWTFGVDGSPVTSHSGVTVKSQGSELVIDGTTEGHEGIYTCTATNDVGTAVQQSHLTVSECRSSLTMLQVPECLTTVILADESRTWTGNYPYLETISLELEKQLQAAGVGTGRTPNHYALVGFGTDDMKAHIVSVNSKKLFLASKVSKAVRSLRTDGDRPDGFHAIKFAMEHLPLRHGQARHCALHILIATQEHSMKALGERVTREHVNSLLCRNGPVLVTALLGSGFLVGSEKLQAFGIDSTLSAFASINGGVVKVQDDITLQQVAYSICNSFRDYGDMALRHHGSVWDLYHFLTAEAVRNGANIEAMANATVTSLVTNFRPCRDCVCTLDDDDIEATTCRIVNRPYYCNCRREGSPEDECTALVNRACSSGIAFDSTSTADPMTILPPECIRLHLDG